MVYRGCRSNKENYQVLNTGKCPKCEKLLTNVKVEHVDINEGFSPKWHGVSLVCPFCSTILSVAIDPVALKTDMVNEVLKGG